MDLKGVIADVYIEWHKKFKCKMRDIEYEYIVYKRYNDDISVVIDQIEKRDVKL